MKRIALLGATGFIGKSLTYELSLKNRFEVSLFSRSKEKVLDFLKDTKIEKKFGVYKYEEFNDHEYSVILNCTGIGNPSILKKAPEEVLKVTEEFDDLIIGYLEKNPEVLYINLSSGVVEGKNIQDLKKITPGDYYTFAKVNSEAKHRAHPQLNIVDLRIFSFFSRFIDPESHFLMGDIVNCIQNQTVLETSSADIMRDYVCTGDLLTLIELVIKKERINDFFDVYSLSPVSKFELLKSLEEKYSLKYKINIDPNSHQTPTGNKNDYFSKNHKAESLGYKPKYTSLSGIDEELGRVAHEKRI